MRCQHHLIPSFPSSVLSKAWPFHLFGKVSVAVLVLTKSSEPNKPSLLLPPITYGFFEPVARVMSLSFHVLMRMVLGEVRYFGGDGGTYSE